MPSAYYDPLKVIPAASQAIREVVRMLQGNADLAARLTGGMHPFRQPEAAGVPRLIVRRPLTPFGERAIPGTALRRITIEVMIEAARETTNVDVFLEELHERVREELTGERVVATGAATFLPPEPAGFPTPARWDADDQVYYSLQVFHVVLKPA